MLYDYLGRFVDRARGKFLSQRAKIRLKRTGVVNKRAIVGGQG